MPLDAGGCQSAGVQPESCGEGFTSDDNWGCSPILPAEACGFGQLAVPGETSCAFVAPCADGAWGDIPTDATTQFVDVRYRGSTHDGSKAHPYVRISEAIAAAAPGAIVAIAAGSHNERLEIQFKPVRLWGRCPSLVEIIGGAGWYAPILLGNGTSGSEVRDVAIRGSSLSAITISGAEDVLIDRVWIHDVTGRGVNLQNDLGPTSARVTRSLVEMTSEIGVNLYASKLELERSVVRDTLPLNGLFGVGIHAGDTGGTSDLVVRSSIVERNRDYGIHVMGSVATIESTVVRETGAASDGTLGLGVAAIEGSSTQLGSSLSLKGSVVAGNRMYGVLVQDSTATIDATVVRDTLPADSDQLFGLGLVVGHAAGQGTDVTVSWSLIDGNHYAGMAAFGALLVADGVRVRNTSSAPAHPLFGDGAVLSRGLTEDPAPNAPPSGPPSEGRFRWCVVERNQAFGFNVIGSELAFENGIIADTKPNGLGAMGDNLAVLAAGPARALVTGSRVVAASRAGAVTFGGALELGSSTMDCNTIDIDTETLFGYESTSIDLGGNVCGCKDERWPCKAVSSQLEPPENFPTP